MTTLVVNWSGYAVGENRRTEFSRKLGRAYPNSRYRAFLDDLAWSLRIAAIKAFGADRCLNGAPISRPCVHFLLDAPRLDVDALVKPVLDAVQLSGVVANDREIVSQGSERARLRDDWPGEKRGPHFLRITISGRKL